MNGTVHRGGRQEQSFRERARAQPEVARLMIRVSRADWLSVQEWALLRRVLGAEALNQMWAEATASPL